MCGAVLVITSSVLSADYLRNGDAVQIGETPVPEVYALYRSYKHSGWRSPLSQLPA